MQKQSGNVKRAGTDQDEVIGMVPICHHLLLTFHTVLLPPKDLVVALIAHVNFLNWRNDRCNEVKQLRAASGRSMNGYKMLVELDSEHS